MQNHCFGGMLSFQVGSRLPKFDKTIHSTSTSSKMEQTASDMAMAVAGAVQVIKRATSLGGTETLIEHRASIEPPDRVVSPPGLLRVSVGLEHVDDLKADLKRALYIANLAMDQLDEMETNN